MYKPKGANTNNEEYFEPVEDKLKVMNTFGVVGFGSLVFSLIYRLV